MSSVSTGVCPGGTNIASCGEHGTCAMLTAASGVCLCTPPYVYEGPVNSDPLDACSSKIDLCTFVAEQGSTLCFNEGYCEPQDEAPYYTCTCQSGYVGENCELFDDPCDTSLIRCYNGGECVFYPFNEQRFTCKCPNGYEGDYCETKIISGIGGFGTQVGPPVYFGLWGGVVVMACLWLYCLLTLVIDFLLGCIKGLIPV
eukprot:GHVP01041966.1.p1 GENE.GHVP01041966.1~~GHVP01041966.1.p1  ORF type:complete len:200 (+),score=17.06 GHVP01041966.1:58-657(+)